MTLTMWRMIKRTFKTEIGRNVFGSEDTLRKELHEMEYTYECGNVTTPAGNIIDFVRVSDVREVIKGMVNDLQAAEKLITLSNLDADTLWLHVSGDKGGKTTKLILQVISANDRHSIQQAKLLGLFEGKDSRNNRYLGRCSRSCKQQLRTSKVSTF